VAIAITHRVRGTDPHTPPFPLVHRTPTLCISPQVFDAVRAMDASAMAMDAVAHVAAVPAAVVAAPVVATSGSFFSSCIFFWFIPACYASWWALFTSISPYLFASVGTALAIGLSVLGAAWGIFITGVSLLGAAIKHPRIQSKNLISVIFCEAVAIYGVIMAIIMQSRIVEAEDGGLPSAYLGYALFAAGLTVGFSNLFCGYVCSCCNSVFLCREARRAWSGAR